MFYVAGTVAVLFAFWVLLSGFFTPFLLTSGVGSAIVVVWFSRRMGIVAHEGHPLRLSMRALITYGPWLLMEILKAGWDVTRRILHPRLPISPTMTRFKPSQRTDLGLIVHANSITLTPGTISVEVGPDEFLVHAISAEGGASLDGSEMDRRVRALELAS
ncbi:MAG: Na+/H+ antiporter subunit E [Gemmatimonadetes bacterium]|nr:Na+/H+ antiporter subunit E [Gemmatimonadota bacterium]